MESEGFLLQLEPKETKWDCEETNSSDEETFRTAKSSFSSSSDEDWSEMLESPSPMVRLDDSTPTDVSDSESRPSSTENSLVSDEVRFSPSSSSSRSSLENTSECGWRPDDIITCSHFLVRASAGEDAAAVVDLPEKTCEVGSKFLSTTTMSDDAESPEIPRVGPTKDRAAAAPQMTFPIDSSVGKFRESPDESLCDLEFSFEDQENFDTSIPLNDSLNESFLQAMKDLSVKDGCSPSALEKKTTTILKKQPIIDANHDDAKSNALPAKNPDKKSSFSRKQKVALGKSIRNLLETETKVLSNESNVSRDGNSQSLNEVETGLGNVTSDEYRRDTVFASPARVLKSIEHSAPSGELTPEQSARVHWELFRDQEFYFELRPGHFVRLEDDEAAAIDDENKSPRAVADLSEEPGKGRGGGPRKIQSVADDANTGVFRKKFREPKDFRSSSKELFDVTAGGFTESAVFDSHEDRSQQGMKVAASSRADAKARGTSDTYWNSEGPVIPGNLNFSTEIFQDDSLPSSNNMTSKRGTPNKSPRMKYATRQNVIAPVYPRRGGRSLTLGDFLTSSNDVSCNKNGPYVADVNDGKRVLWQNSGSTTGTLSYDTDFPPLYEDEEPRRVTGGESIHAENDDPELAPSKSVGDDERLIDGNTTTTGDDGNEKLFVTAGDSLEFKEPKEGDDDERIEEQQEAAAAGVASEIYGCSQDEYVDEWTNFVELTGGGGGSSCALARNTLRMSCSQEEISNFGAVSNGLAQDQLVGCADPGAATGDDFDMGMLRPHGYANNGSSHPSPAGLLPNPRFVPGFRGYFPVPVRSGGIHQAMVPRHTASFQPPYGAVQHPAPIQHPNFAWSGWPPANPQQCWTPLNRPRIPFSPAQQNQVYNPGVFPRPDSSLDKERSECCEMNLRTMMERGSSMSSMESAASTEPPKSWSCVDCGKRRFLATANPKRCALCGLKSFSKNANRPMKTRMDILDSLAVVYIKPDAGSKNAVTHFMSTVEPGVAMEFIRNLFDLGSVSNDGGRRCAEALVGFIVNTKRYGRKILAGLRSTMETMEKLLQKTLKERAVGDTTGLHVIHRSYDFLWTFLDTARIEQPDILRVLPLHYDKVFLLILKTASEKNFAGESAENVQGKLSLVETMYRHFCSRGSKTQDGPSPETTSARVSELIVAIGLKACHSDNMSPEGCLSALSLLQLAVDSGLSARKYLLTLNIREDLVFTIVAKRMLQRNYATKIRILSILLRCLSIQVSWNENNYESSLNLVRCQDVGNTQFKRRFIEAFLDADLVEAVVRYCMSTTEPVLNRLSLSFLRIVSEHERFYEEQAEQVLPKILLVLRAFIIEGVTRHRSNTCIQKTIASGLILVDGIISRTKMSLDDYQRAILDILDVALSHTGMLSSPPTSNNMNTVQSSDDEGKARFIEGFRADPKIFACAGSLLGTIACSLDEEVAEKRVKTALITVERSFEACIEQESVVNFANVGLKLFVTTFASPAVASFADGDYEHKLNASIMNMSILSLDEQPRSSLNNSECAGAIISLIFKKCLPKVNELHRSKVAFDSGVIDLMRLVISSLKLGCGVLEKSGIKDLNFWRKLIGNESWDKLFISSGSAEELVLKSGWFAVFFHALFAIPSREKKTSLEQFIIKCCSWALKYERDNDLIGTLHRWTRLLDEGLAFIGKQADLNRKSQRWNKSAGHHAFQEPAVMITSIIAFFAHEAYNASPDERLSIMEPELFLKILRRMHEHFPSNAGFSETTAFNRVLLFCLAMAEDDDEAAESASLKMLDSWMMHRLKIGGKMCEDFAERYVHHPAVLLWPFRDISRSTLCGMSVLKLWIGKEVQNSLANGKGDPAVDTIDFHFPDGCCKLPAFVKCLAVADDLLVKFVMLIEMLSEAGVLKITESNHSQAAENSDIESSLSFGEQQRSSGMDWTQDSNSAFALSSQISSIATQKDDNSSTKLVSSSSYGGCGKRTNRRSVARLAKLVPLLYRNFVELRGSVFSDDASADINRIRMTRQADVVIDKQKLLHLLRKKNREVQEKSLALISAIISQLLNASEENPPFLKVSGVSLPAGGQVFEIFSDEEIVELTEFLLDDICETASHHSMKCLMKFLEYLEHSDSSKFKDFIQGYEMRLMVHTLILHFRRFNNVVEENILKNHQPFTRSSSRPLDICFKFLVAFRACSKNRRNFSDFFIPEIVRNLYLLIEESSLITASENDADSSPNFSDGVLKKLKNEICENWKQCLSDDTVDMENV
ncbi:unnamed protein product [Notodromas monacha]|uniref:Uncharacterized protein n=1 Tax=Notodromas monacha TaxID=399045 RepID=A0A7R9G8R0_9CRUS|nr:unnamed protein product [Notodromas monacha]CAG0913475.1 unnamed protein product [Notodromas monacha]